MTRIERLTAQDLMMVWPEEVGWSQDIGALAILEGDRLLDDRGRLRIEDLRAHIGRRLHLLPRSRQVIHHPRPGLGWPLWVDVPGIDLARHVRVLPLETPADEARLLAAVEDLRCRGLDRSRPLWEIWFLPGLPGRRVGFFMKLHHAVADGVAGIAALGAFVDPDPDPPAMRPQAWAPSPAPSARELFDDNVRRRLRGLDRKLEHLAHPLESLRASRRAWPAVREAFFEERAPRTSLNRRIGRHRRLALIRGDLDEVRRVAHAHGAKVNDVVLAAVGGGLRELLAGRGERVGGPALRAFVPVSLHGEGEARGNLDGGMVVPLPAAEPDPVRRLRLIAAETAERKRRPRPPGGALFRTIAIQRAWLRLLPRQRIMNTYVANVPGPPVPLYVAGARVLEVFPLVPILGNVAVGVGVLSYAGQLNLTVVADRDRCPDLDRFVAGVRGSMAALAASVSAGDTAGQASASSPGSPQKGTASGPPRPSSGRPSGS